MDLDGHSRSYAEGSSPSCRAVQSRSTHSRPNFSTPAFNPTPSLLADFRLPFSYCNQACRYHHLSSVEKDVPPREVESFIAVAAKTHGIDPEISFPFEVRGSIGPYVMHVNVAPTNGEHGMDLPMAVTIQDKGDRLDSLVAGLYASLDLMGIATHGGERTHAHWVSLDMAKTAHLDRWGLKAGAFLLLPKPP